MSPEQIVEILMSGPHGATSVDAPRAFDVGDAVVVKNDHPAGHTRVPRYVRGRRGVIHRDHGVYPFQDDVAPGQRSGRSTCTR